ncbi:MAG: TrbG/VirB9 family P-type conjugative transfer protein, partial [Bryobacteraceae bacterium]
PNARNVAYHDQDIVPLATELRYTTIIVLPKEEKILEVGCGDKDNWVVDKAENYAFVKPAKLGAKTNLNIITESGNLYSFFVSDVSNTTGAHADTKVYVRPADASLVSAMNGKPRFVSAEEMEAAKRQVQLAEETSKAVQNAATKQVQDQTEAFQSQYPSKLHFDYRWNEQEAQKLGILEVFRDDKFTYIKADSQELPVVYEIKDGKHSLINAPFQNGLFTIPKLVDDGEIVVGKRKVEFRRAVS